MSAKTRMQKRMESLGWTVQQNSKGFRATWGSVKISAPVISTLRYYSRILMTMFREECRKDRQRAKLEKGIVKQGLKLARA